MPWRRIAPGGSPELPVFPEDGDLLRDAVQETGARLVIVDPFLAFLSGRISSVSDQWVRHALTPCPKR